MNATENACERCANPRGCAIAGCLDLTPPAVCDKTTSCLERFSVPLDGIPAEPVGERASSSTGNAAGLILSGALTAAAVEINHSRLRNEDNLSFSTQRALQALEQVLAEAGANLRAGRELFVREDGSSALGGLDSVDSVVVAGTIGVGGDEDG